METRWYCRVSRILLRVACRSYEAGETGGSVVVGPGEMAVEGGAWETTQEEEGVGWDSTGEVSPREVSGIPRNQEEDDLPVPDVVVACLPAGNEVDGVVAS